MREFHDLIDRWLGVSICTAAEIEKARKLANIDAAVRFWSMEPLLEEIDLNGLWDDWWESANRPDWIIAGAETGPGARPAKLDWFRKLRDQCRAAGVPFFLKQVDANHDRVLDGRTWDEWPAENQIHGLEAAPPLMFLEEAELHV